MNSDMRIILLLAQVWPGPAVILCVFRGESWDNETTEQPGVVLLC